MQPIIALYSAPYDIIGSTGGDLHGGVEVSPGYFALADSSSHVYPVLIDYSTLRGTFVVDVRQDGGAPAGSDHLCGPTTQAILSDKARED